MRLEGFLLENSNFPAIHVYKITNMIHCDYDDESRSFE